MPNNYSKILANALEKYTKPEEHGRGYRLSVFSRMRHSFKINEKISALQKQINELDDAAARELLKNYLTTTKLNIHSFGSYLIDELIKDDPTLAATWKEFDPKPVKYYEDTKPLYRGMRLSEENALKIFNNGFEYKEASVEDLSSTHTWNSGISTTKSFSAALMYAAPVVQDLQAERSLMSGECWVFQIDSTKLPPNSGIDILATHTARRNKDAKKGNWSSWFGSTIGMVVAANADHEVNITCSIPGAAITKLYKINRFNQAIDKTYKKVEKDFKEEKKPKI